MSLSQSDDTRGKTLYGLRVLAFESRRATEMAELIRRHGGEPLSAPALREVPLDDNREVLDYIRRLDGGGIDIVILMTGVGVRTMTISPRACCPWRTSAARAHLPLGAAR
jgi:uroporphyrinogen-III synthase